MARVELKDLLKIKLASGSTASLLIYDDPVASTASSIVASILNDGAFGVDLGSPSKLMADVYAAIHQDDDAHDTCSLTACLNPLHPGPCKGWKGTLFKAAPGAFHALEKAKADKANTARIKKIEDLKAKGLPIPKKLLVPIQPKPHPHVGKTANEASGEAHEAGKAVTDSAGVHVNAPGKVTLGEAVKKIKASDATAEKGPKGKKPTVASKGIAAVIAQEKVTPQYKLDKAAQITPEQWAGLTGDEKAVIRGELSKIKKDGFGPQQKKADELLTKLPAPGAQMTVAEHQAANAEFQKKAAAEVAAKAPLAKAKEPDLYDKLKTAPGLHPPKAEPSKTPKLGDTAPASKKGVSDQHGILNKPHVGGEVKTTSAGLPKGYKISKDSLGYSLKHNGKLIRTSATQEALEKYAHDHASGNLGGHAPSHADVIESAKADLAEALKGHMPVVKEATEVKQAAKAPAPKASDGPKVALPKHVEEAVAMAKGEAPGASWSKNHLAAYQKLSPEEFKALAPDVQAKVISELEKGKSKFLDPKKIKASEELLAKFKGPKPKIENVGEIGFKQHYNDHSVTPAQAKEAVKDVPPAGLFIAAKQLTGLDDTDNPDSPELANKAMDTAKVQVGSQTKMFGPEVLDDPEIKTAITQANDAIAQANYAFAVGKAKSDTYTKVTKALLNDKDLSPIQKAALRKYQLYLLDHPMDTKAEQTQKLANDAVAAGLALNAKLQAKLKSLNAPTAAEMSPTQIKSAVEDLLGPDAVKPHFKPNFGEFNTLAKEGKQAADEVTKGYPEQINTDPQVAAKKVALAQAVAELAGQKLTSKKLTEHVQQHHFKAVAGKVGVNGQKISLDDVKVIVEHASMLGKEANTANTIPAAEAKVAQLESDLKNAAEAAKAKLPSGPVTVSDYDKDLIGYAFRNAYTKVANKSVVWGTDYYSLQKIKNNEDYPSLAQDLGDLKNLAGEVALAHAQARAAELSVPTDPDTGQPVMGTPEAIAWAAALTHKSAVEGQFNALHKTAQAKLDKVRTEAGLKKRALPKFDNSAVKTAAAETSYYKTAQYNAPNYGKSAAAKAYMQAKLGDKLGVKHQSKSEKAAEKVAAQVKTTGVGTVSNTGKYVPPPTSQPTKDKFPSAAVAGSTPSQASAEKYGFAFQSAPPKKVGDWPGDQGGAYVTTKEGHLAAAQRVLANAEIKHGQAAQTQFKWSINNMDGKGAPSGSKGSLYNYTGSGYDAVNSKLNSLPPGSKKTGSTSIANIDKGMEASPAPEEDLILYRGFKDPHGVFSSGKWNDVNVAGMEWSQKSYSSTSGNLGTAQSFAGYGGVVMRVIVPKSMKVKGINAKGGQHPGEAEVILQRGLRYRVVADYGKHGNSRYIDVMVVPDPYAQAE